MFACSLTPPDTANRIKHCQIASSGNLDARLDCTIQLSRKGGKSLSLVEKQGRMRSTAQSIGRKCEICEPPSTDLAANGGNAWKYPWCSEQRGGPSTATAARMTKGGYAPGYLSGRSLQTACGLNAGCDLGNDSQRSVDGADVLSDCA